MPYHIYILKSLKDGNLYIGQTGNLRQRLGAHFEGRVRSTKNRRPLELIHGEEFPTRSETIIREHELKRLTSKEFIKTTP